MVVLAQEEAQRLCHDYVGTEHLLLGLLRAEEGLAARVLESLDVTLELARALVVQIIGTGGVETEGQIPFTPQAKQALERSLREALSLGHNYIGTEHLLLGLVGDSEGVAVRILLDFDADPQKIHNTTMLMLWDVGAPSSAPRWSAQAVADTEISAGPELPSTAADTDLGWRERPIALAALGAAVLARLAFEPSRTGPLEPLEMQLLARLTLGPADGPLAEPGELFQSLTTALACDRDELRNAIRALAGQRLIVVCAATGR